MLIPDTVATPRMWQDHASAMTMHVNDTLGAKGVTVKILDTDFEKTGKFDADTPAAWYTPATNDVVVNIRKMPEPKKILDAAPTNLTSYMTNPYYWRGKKDTFGVLSGTLVHEIGHSMVSNYITEGWYRELTNPERQVIIALEEIRAERTMAKKAKHSSRRFTWMRTALRACARTLFPTKEDFEEAKDAKGRINLFHWSTNSILLIGRANSKIVNWYEVREYYEFTEDILGWERVERMLDLAEEFERIVYPDPARMTEIAREWVEMFRDENEDGEAGDGEGMEMVALPGLMDMVGEILEEMGKKIEAWIEHESDTHSPDEPADSEVDGKATVEAEEERLAKEDDSVGHGYGKGTYGATKKRKPTAEEKSAASRLGKRLEKLSAPEKVVTHSRSVAPPGRLKARAAVAQAADRAQGRASTAQPWESKRRRYIENPPLTVGIMTDVSGSQGWATQFSASSAWIVNRATAHVNGKAAAVVFGEKAEITAMPGKTGEVVVRAAVDGSEAFNDGLAALDYMLKLESGRGIRILFVVTDGYFVAPGEMEAAAKWVKRMVKAGVNVIWVTPSGEHERYGATDLPVIPKGATVMKVNKRTADATKMVSEIANTIEKAVKNRVRA